MYVQFSLSGLLYFKMLFSSTSCSFSQTPLEELLPLLHRPPSWIRRRATGRDSRERREREGRGRMGNLLQGLKGLDARDMWNGVRVDSG